MSGTNRARLTIVALLALSGRSALAEPSIVAGGPELDVDGHSLALVVAGRGPDGQPRPVTEPELVVDRGEPAPAIDKQSLGDYTEEHPKWTPPISLGVVYQWSQGTPQSVMDGLERMFKNLPARLAVFPTYYGHGYPRTITKITAARAASGELAEYAQAPGEDHKLAAATRLNLAKLVEDGAPIKMLFIVTDGRGAPGGASGSPFATLGEELRRYGLQVSIVSFPPPADPDDARANVRELADAAGARLLTAARATDVASLLESLAETISTADRVRFPLPLSQRLMGGPAKLSVRGTVTGAAVRATIGEVELPGRRDAVYVGMGALGLAALGGLALIARRRNKPESRDESRSRGRGGHESRAGRAGGSARAAAAETEVDSASDDDDRNARGERSRAGRTPRVGEPREGWRPRGDVSVRPGAATPERARGNPSGRPLASNRRPEPARAEEDESPEGSDDESSEPLSPMVAQLDRIVAAGLSPERAVLALSQAFGSEAARLARATPDDLAGAPHLGTRAGEVRLRAIQGLIAARPAIETFAREHADVIGPALREGVPPAEAARRLRAKLPLESWSALLRLSSPEVEAALTSANRTAPRLVDPRAASYVRDVRDQLAAVPMPSVVAWLVRVAGPSAAGDTVVLPPGGGSAGGPGSAVVLSTRDPSLVAGHADFAIDGDAVTVTGGAGSVSIDGSALSGTRSLSDGQTLTLGRSLFVVRIVRGGIGAPPVRRGPKASARPARTPRG